MRSSLLRRLALALGACLVAVVVACAFTGFGPKQLMSLRQRSDAVSGRTLHEPIEPAAPGTGTSGPENLLKVMADAPPLPSGQFDVGDLPRIFPAFQHKPFEAAGFNAVMLPFSYSDPGHLGDANEAMALTALISNDLDWSPGCYCARHAYFVFKRDRDAAEGFGQRYDPGQVASFIRRWAATHAVGGQLTRTADGYKGRLEIFNADGAKIFTREYNPARSFWDVLGDMVVDAMTALDVAPPQPLSRYLHEPRCTNFQSVAALGSAGFMAERSPDEFGVYERILHADPGFAMVRHWYANQKHWRDGDDRSWEVQNGLALSARVEPASLGEFTPANCPDPQLAARFAGWLDQAEALASPDSPIVLAARLRKNCIGAEPEALLIERGLKVAAQYPNSHDLLLGLSLKARDRFMAASLLTASLLDHYQPGTGSKSDEAYDLAWMCDQVSRDDVTMEILSAMGPRQPKFHLDLLLEALCCGGRYAEAADLYPLLDSKAEKNVRAVMAPRAAFAAFMTENSQLLEQVLRDQSDVLAAQHLADVFQLYSDAFNGRKVNLGVTPYVDYPMFWKLFLVAQGDALHGTSTYHHLVTEALFQWPLNRLLWIAEDNYQRRDPSHDAAALYGFLETFLAYDPWATAAVADFRKRGGTDKPIDVEILRTDIHQAMRDGPYPSNLGALDWKHVVTPWRVAACVHQLLDQRNSRAAAQIARLYADYESKIDDPWQVAVAGELVRKATAAQSN